MWYLLIVRRNPPVPAARATVAKSHAPTSKHAAVSSQSTAASPPGHTTETKIALEIRELKEREEELRKMRDARLAAKKIQQQQQNSSGSLAAIPNIPNSDEVDEEFTEEELDEGGSCSSREMLDDHLTSLTTTTDEGNFSECGDGTSSEDKSSNGSNR